MRWSLDNSFLVHASSKSSFRADTHSFYERQVVSEPTPFVGNVTRDDCTSELAMRGPYPRHQQSVSLSTVCCTAYM